MVQRADEVVYAGGLGEGLDEGCVGLADEFGFEADEDVDLRRVEGLQALGLEEVGFVPWWEGGEAGLRVIELLGAVLDL